MTSAEEQLRRQGYRVTGPRRRVLRALAGLGHATPDELAAALARDGDDPIALSTVYRNLEALTEAGVVTHSHLDHGPPSYHLVDHGDHLHLVCGRCGSVTEAEPGSAEELAGNLLHEHGFVADVTHMAIHGRCRHCAGTAAPGGEDR